MSMLRNIKLKKPYKIFNFFPLCFIIGLYFTACKSDEKAVPLQVKSLSKAEVNQQAKAIEALVNPEFHQDLKLDLWAVDSLVADPISLQIDDFGNAIYSKTNRRKISEFDIRSHQDWEIASIGFKNVADRKAFIREELSPENSEKNEWLPDINGDGSHDWKDLTIEKENVFEVKDTDGDGKADQSLLIASDFNEETSDVAGAVLKYDDALFVGVAPDLWRMTDTNGDGLMDKKESLAHGFGVHIGFGGHNMSGLKVGPEGKIYWGIGDIGFSGKDDNGKLLDYPNCGVIARANPDGSDFEIFAYGVRNTHEFDFDEYGNLISVDNDGDHKGESERIVYLVEGSDTGWRINWQFGKYRDPKNNGYKVWMDEKMHLPRNEDQAAYFIPTIANYINGPTGFQHNPGTGLGEQWKNKFFVAEFGGNAARSGIHAFDLKPKGAGFEMGETQQILTGILATGMDFAPDGALYFSDWIDGWVNKGYGRIWKFTDETSNSAIRKLTETHLSKNYSELSIEELKDLLGFEDQRVRQKAQFELAKRGAEGMEVFKAVLAHTGNQLARVHSIWGISQLARDNSGYAEALIPYLTDKDPEIIAQACKWLGDLKYTKAAGNILPLLDSEAPRVQFFAAEALGKLKHQAAFEPMVKLLQDNDNEDLYIRHAASLALSRLAEASTIADLSKHPSEAVRLGAVIALRRLGDPEITSFLQDENEYIVAEVARAINDDFSIEAAIPELGKILNTTHFSSEPLLRRAINANLRWGTEEGFNNLLSYANSSHAPEAMRVEAIAALSTWTSPSVLDRVDGWYRGEITRDIMAFQTSAAEILMDLSKDGSREIREGAVLALGELKIEAANQHLLTVLSNDNDAAVRAESLRALAKIPGSPMDKAVEKALSDSQRSVRVAGLDLLEELTIPDERKAALLDEVIQKRTVEEQQAAVNTLSRLDQKSTKDIFEKLLTQYESNKLPQAIELEFFEAMETREDAQLKERYNKVHENMSQDDLLASYSGSLYGGDLVKGRKIFFQHATAQCIKCHAYDDFGGNAGPKLNGVGARLTREQLLEALIDPSKRLAPGFGVVTLSLDNDKKVAGIKMDETEQSITLKMGNQPDTLIMKNQILERKDVPSSMPDMKQFLSRREIRDLVSFLVTLEEDFN
ncbi:HEAT repeat domain-containing protein [Cyclobacterium marinum]|uniref:Heme-binding protein n=1 Tax=Cyclobacterium marinum (strain ATCC 25205 / DSM 745 / LMG 13164 / NCIMB 1802) TaxID=880070 RepID=G0J324_CYCMS|nr:heme-binding protein [Cyclobacterium marinum DSM 745]